MTVFVTDSGAYVVDDDGAFVIADDRPGADPRLFLPTPPSGGTRVGNDLTDSGGVAVGRNDQHANQALSNLIQFFRDKNRIAALMDSYSAQAQELEQVFWDLLTKRYLSNATGVNLEALGLIVGETRQGRLDEAYRAAIRVRVLVNRSNGRIEGLLTIAKQMLGGGDDVDVKLIEAHPCAMTIRIQSELNGASALDLARMLRRAKAGGVRLVTIVELSVGRTFRWGNTPTSAGLTVDAAPSTGWGSTSDPGAGGRWAVVLVGS